MKKLLSFLPAFLALSLSFVLLTCSSENTIVQPLENTGGTKPLAKAATTAIDHSQDTIITLPISGKTIEIEKGLPANMIKQLDQYLSKHPILNERASTSPDLQNCTEHSATYWNVENQYEPTSGKYLGIWTHKVDWAKLHNQYGFTYIYASFSEANSATSAGFNQANIMIGLNGNQTESDFMTNPAYNYYYLDEPLQNNHLAQVLSYSTWISERTSTGKLLISDYFWPDPQNFCEGEGDGPMIKPVLDYASNIYIYYDGGWINTLCGNAHDYWNEYKAYYGIPVKNLTNQIFLAYHQENWGDLLNVAMAWSVYGAMNPIWAYGDDNGVTEGTVNSYCAAAWETGWLLRQEKQYTTIWKCDTDNPSPCAGCSWPNVGTWYVYETFYTGVSRYVSY